METIEPGRGVVGAGEGEGGDQQTPKVPKEVLADLYSEIADSDPDAHFTREAKGLGLFMSTEPEPAAEEPKQG